MFTKKTYPEFWETYKATLETPLPKHIADVKFVVLDTETTGFNVKKDRILSIGALVLQHQIIQPKQAFEVFVAQEHYNKETAKIHGILKNSKKNQLTEFTALQQTLKVLEGAVLVAHHTWYDVAMLNRALGRHGLPKLKNKTLDTATLYPKTLSQVKQKALDGNVSLDTLAEVFGISQNDRHTALGDAYITAIAFLQILEQLKPTKLNDVLESGGFLKFW